MKKDKYFNFMRETSELFAPVINKYFDPCRSKENELYDILMLFIRTRLNRPLQKPTLLRLSYEICGGNDWKKIIPAAAAFELINISSYQSNCAFDNKLQVITSSQKDNQFMASAKTRELAMTVASELKPPHPKGLGILL